MTDRERRVITQAAHGELGAAMVQMIDSDDKIICDHVRKAQRMLAELLDNSLIRKAEGKPARQMASEAEAEEACKYLRAIIEAAENSNQAGENAAVTAADGSRLRRAVLRYTKLYSMGAAAIDLRAMCGEKHIHVGPDAQCGLCLRNYRHSVHISLKGLNPDHKEAS